MSENAVKVNDQMPRFAFDYFKSKYLDKISGKKVMFLGVSYRGDVGDTRFSQLKKSMNYLLKKMLMYIYMIQLYHFGKKKIYR